MPADRTFLIAGDEWTWRYSRLKGAADGWCFSGPEHRIVIDQRLRGQRRLEVEIHEALHAMFPQISEEVVTGRAVDLRRILWTLGYRLKEE
jgi:hypothetical protein